MKNNNYYKRGKGCFEIKARKSTRTGLLMLRLLSSIGMTNYPIKVIYSGWLNEVIKISFEGTKKQCELFLESMGGKRIDN